MVRIALDAAIEAGIGEGLIVGSVVGERPRERLGEEGLGCRQSRVANST